MDRKLLELILQMAINSISLSESVKVLASSVTGNVDLPEDVQRRILNEVLEIEVLQKQLLEKASNLSDDPAGETPLEK